MPVTTELSAAPHSLPRLSVPRTAPHDAAFEKYASGGAYHWRQISRSVRGHHAFTAERYRRTIAALGPVVGLRVLDFGCGDGALLGMIAKRTGGNGELHGYDPNEAARALAAATLREHGIGVQLHDTVGALPSDYYDRVLCADVIEHVHDVTALIGELARTLRTGGLAVVTTPIRLSEFPRDRNHVREWFPSEFAALFEVGPLRLVRHDQVIPLAAAEIYSWRPPLLFGFPPFRLLCNLVSIYANSDALTWLRAPARYFMMQIAVLEKV